MTKPPLPPATQAFLDSIPKPGRIITADDHRAIAESRNALIESEAATTAAIIEAQADLQTALGLARLRDDEWRDFTVEDRLARSLARLHKLLDTRGSAMYDPATHPEV